MGAWFRLRADFDVSPFREDTKVVLRAMQRHGMILADNGSNWYFTGTSEQGWDTDLLDELKGIPAGAFDAVVTSSLVADPNSGRVAAEAPATTTTTAAPTTTTVPPAPATTAPRPTTTTRPPATTTTMVAPTTTSAPTTTTTAPATTTTTADPEAGDPPGDDLAAGPPPGGSGPSRWWFVAGLPAAGGLAFAAFRLRPRRQAN